MKTDKKIVSILIAVCLVLSIVEFPVMDSAEAASGKKIILKEGKSVTLKVKKAKIKRVTWKSKNKKIATVSKKGIVKAKSAGSTKITAKATLKNGKKYTCVYKVSVQKKKSSPSPAKTALPNKPTPTATAMPQKPTAEPAPTYYPPRIVSKTASTAQGEVADWKPIIKKMISCTKLSSNPQHFENQLVSSYDALTALIEELKEYPSSPNDQIISELKKYDEEYFQNHVLCLMAVQMDYSCIPSVRQVYSGDGGGAHSDIKMDYVEVRAYEDGQLLPCVMENYFYRIEMEKSDVIPDYVEEK